ncbi:Mpp10-domain-containing protein [Artomyces pyxidatus]|uniref:Mpp10-domain-containing protein n=1 Tax=Artomyces pyxidatus TaxID=48021 RepID=A0ACB8TGY5_9AGAM|nr:Mpp10-domain-containing protein [Artomyces pyxidatus]
MEEVLDIPLPPEFQLLSSLLDDHPESFAAGSKDIQEAALRATEYVFNLALQSEAQSQSHITELLESFSPAQGPQTRSQTRANGKRKRSPSRLPAPKIVLQATPLSSLFTEGMNEEQIWAQLELRTQSVCQTLDLALQETEGEEGEDAATGAEKRRGDSDAPGVEGKNEDGLDDEDEAEEDDDESDEGEEEGDDEEGSDQHEVLGEGVEGLREESEEEYEEQEMLEEPSRRPPSRTSFRKRPKGGAHSELNDGFFDLAAFNAETEEAEARSVSRGTLAKDSDDDSEDDEAVDYFASVDAQDVFEEDTQGEQGEAYYRDFFEAPARTSPKAGAASVSTLKASKVRFHDEVRVKTIKPRGKGLPLFTMRQIDEDDEDAGEDGDFEGNGDDDFGEDSMAFDDFELDEDDENDKELQNGSDEQLAFGGQQTMDRLKDDLFADDDEPDYEMSTHQKRLADLREQIATLETENVAKKDWTLMGEATSRTRPQNSLLEEDLDFERVMKAIPVITEETVLGLEVRIKARIQEGRFDDVVRRRPVDDKPFLPSRLFELKDTKSSQSLAQIYEDEFTAAQTGGAVGEDRDGKLKKEHEEIEKLWESMSMKLDALSNAHFTPKAPKATISTITNVASTSLESALPTSKSAASMLAPEEVFERGSADLRAKGELAPDEKRALRNKHKKKRKKERDALENSVDKFAKLRGVKGVKAQKEAALRSVIKNGKGVTVVGKKSQDVKKSRALIPPVEQDSPNSYRGNSTSPRPPVRSAATSYVASRDGDPYSSRPAGNIPPAEPSYRDRYQRNNPVGDVYSRGHNNLDSDRNELFSGYKPREGPGRFADGPSEPAPGEENDEDVEGIKQQTRFLKQDSVNSTRNALRLAREAEETARNTVNRLGDQSGEQVIDVLYGID